MSNQKPIETMNDAELVFACVEPVIRKIRGKRFEVKSEVTASLPPPIRALLMFQVVYGHASEGVLRFFSSTSYLLERDGMWKAMKGGPRFFRDDRLSCLMGDLESLYNSLFDRMGKDNLGNLDFMLDAVRSDPILADSIANIDKMLSDTLQSSICLVAGHIRRNPNEYMLWEERS